MNTLTLDGSNSFRGVEFVKILITGSSNLATEEYVDDAVATGGGVGGGGYTDGQIDTFLSNKLTGAGAGYTQAEVDSLIAGVSGGGAWPLVQ